MSGGTLLLLCTAVALAWANSPLGDSYERLSHALHFWVNDVLMAVFFFQVGMEIKRELRTGELGSPKRAALPILAALGGVVVPAILYALFNMNGAGSRGWGIPMATDIAFSIGVLALLGNRIPLGLKVFLTALAIVDDIVAVLVIAVFYQSGIHSSIAGVLLAFTIPTTSLARWERVLHPWVTFGIMPLFALVNAGVAISGDFGAMLRQPITLGVIAGLVLGKPLGITLASWAAVRLGWAALPKNVSWRQLHGAGWLAGIGFTMSLFVTGLAFTGETQLTEAKVGILLASLLAGAVGLLILFKSKA